MDDEARQKLFKLSRKEVRLHGKILNSPIPTWDEFKGYIERVVDEYNDRPHRSLPKFTDREGKRRHMSPNEFWALKVAEFGEPPSVSPEEEGYLFRPQVMRTVRRGEVSLFSNTYYSAELMEFNGETVRGSATTCRTRLGLDLRRCRPPYLQSGMAWQLDGLYACQRLGTRGRQTQRRTSETQRAATAKHPEKKNAVYRPSNIRTRSISGNGVGYESNQG